jgi:drug/metabolite transporter (DMT)-like permease
MTSANSDPDSDDSQQPDTPSPLLADTSSSQDSPASQLAQDIEALEAEKNRLNSEKTQLQSQIADLREDYTQLIALTQSLRQLANIESERIAAPTTNQAEPSLSGPLLPGESKMPTKEFASTSQERTLDLPTPSTSQQRRRRTIERQGVPATKVGRGLMLSAIATALVALHYCLFSALAQGGTWFNLINIGQLGSGFVPSTALLWLRMLIVVPGLLLLAPQLYRETWNDLQDWLYSREQLLWPLIGSGIALFFSQILLYQSIGLVGAVIGSALFFLYPLTAIPAGLVLRQEQALTPLGVLALVAIAMGALLIAQPIFATGSSRLLWTGLMASVALSLYMLLTNHCYQQRCHPMPTSIAQFSTVAVLSSLVLLVKPLQLSDIGWLGLFLWGALIGALMLVAYLLNYASLLTIGPRAAIVAALTPLLTTVFSFSFTPAVNLAVIQWTGMMMITVGGVALGKEKLDKALLQS